MYFVVVGGGLMGIEWVVEFYDFICDDLGKMYFELMCFVKIMVYDVVLKVLLMFDKVLVDYVMGYFVR